MKSAAAILASLLLTFSTSLFSQQASIGPDALLRLDLLPQLKTQVFTGMFSSYDRTGGNDDGFSGKYSYLRKEGDNLVIAEMNGPGVIYRMHMPGPQPGIIEFYFDGEKNPRISMPVADMVDGKHAPFLAPLTGGGVGGRYVYTPLPYRISCKIVIKAPVFCFYDINYATYPKDSGIETFVNPPAPEWSVKMKKIAGTVDAAGSNISSLMAGEGIRQETVKTDKTLTAGKATEIFRTTKPGRITGMRIGPAGVFAGKEKDIILNIYWDNDPNPAISCPVGDFFGYSFGEPATRSLFSGTDGNTNYFYLPMPFAQAARVELVNERIGGEPPLIHTEIDVAPQGKKPDEGHFYAWWHRENPCTPGKPYTYLNTGGNGHVVGVFLQSQGKNPGGTPFFEGDDVVVLDGNMSIHGTGSEDSFNGGWYDVPARWEERTSFPFSGCLDYKKYLGRTGGYRWMIGDAYVFRKNIDYTIEHGPEGNLENTDYTSVTFFYSAVRPDTDLTLADVKTRLITDPERVVFVPGWNVPIHSSPLKNGVIEKKAESVGGAWVRYFSLKTSGPDEFGPHHVSFIFDIPASGKYRVNLKAVKGPDQGIIQLFRHDSPVGEPIDLYAPEQKTSEPMTLGSLELTEGDNTLYFKLIGQNANSTGLNMKLVEIIFEKLH
jgi:hypothetical protein